MAAPERNLMNSHVRIIITCFLVGIVLLVLRKKQEAPCSIIVSSEALQSTARQDEPQKDDAQIQPPDIQKIRNVQVPAKFEPRSQKARRARRKKRESTSKTQAGSESYSAATEPVTPAEKKQEIPVILPADLGTQTITIEPNIKSKNLSYKYGFISYSPTSISLTINDQKIEANNYDPITVRLTKDNTVTTSCVYKFTAGYEGTKKALWKVTPGETFQVTFDWKSKEKIQLKGAELLSTEG